VQALGANSGCIPTYHYERSPAASWDLLCGGGGGGGWWGVTHRCEQRVRDVEHSARKDQEMGPLKRHEKIVRDVRPELSHQRQRERDEAEDHELFVCVTAGTWRCGEAEAERRSSKTNAGGRRLQIWLTIVKWAG